MVALITISSCNGRKKYVLATEVEIRYWGSIQKEDWIEIDGIKLIHAVNDTLQGCNIDYLHDYISLNEMYVDEDEFYVPTTEYYSCLEGKRFVKTEITPGDITQNLLSALNDFAPLPEGELTAPFRNSTNSYEMATGILRISKSNGEQFRVYTSDNYKAQISKLK